MHGGELVIRGGDGSARIHVLKGGVAWVVCDATAERLSHVLQREAGLRRAQLRVVLRACRKTQTNFGEMLVRMELMDADLLRRCLLLHNARQLLATLRLRGPLEVEIEERVRSYDSTLLFSWEELRDVARSLIGTAPPPPSEPERLDGLAAELRDCTALVTVQASTGVLTGVWPMSLREQVGTGALRECVDQLFGADLGTALAPSSKPGGDRIEKWVFIQGGAIRVVARSPVDPQVVVMLAFDAGVGLGRALRDVERVLAELAIA